MVYQSCKGKTISVWGEKMNGLINEVGHDYGPWHVTELLITRYPNNGTAQFRVVCRHCGYTKIYIGNHLRFDKFAHHCNRCKGM